MKNDMVVTLTGYYVVWLYSLSVFLLVSALTLQILHPGS